MHPSSHSGYLVEVVRPNELGVLLMTRCLSLVVGGLRLGEHDASVVERVVAFRARI